jgi:hypothetical protein
MEPENTTKKDRNKNYLLDRKNKTDSRKIVNKLTYNPAKHKQKWTKKSRLLLQQKVIPTPRTVTPSTTIKFGSFKVNGLDLEAAWAVEELLKNRGFDVNIQSENLTINNS